MRLQESCTVEDWGELGRDLGTIQQPGTSVPNAPEDAEKYPSVGSDR